jgi:hypothetical protein
MNFGARPGGGMMGGQAQQQAAMMQAAELEMDTMMGVYNAYDHLNFEYCFAYHNNNMYT